MKKDQIEGNFGGDLEWYFVDGRRRQIIRRRIEIGGYKDEDSWDEIHESLVDAMIRLESSLRPHLERIRI